jgi:hypothetical protein
VGEPAILTRCFGNFCVVKARCQACWIRRHSAFNLPSGSLLF